MQNPCDAIILTKPYEEKTSKLIETIDSFRSSQNRGNNVPNNQTPMLVTYSDSDKRFDEDLLRHESNVYIGHLIKLVILWVKMKLMQLQESYVEN